MKIYKLISHYRDNCKVNHGYFDFVECQAKILDLSLQNNIDKIEIKFDNVKTYKDSHE